MSVIATPNFIFPRRNEPCLCGSGNAFKACCGSLQADRNPPEGMFIIPNAISKATCEEIVNIGQVNDREWLTMRAPDPNSNSLIEVKDQNRVTQGVKLGSSRQKIIQLVKDAFLRIEPLGDIKMLWYEEPGLLRYTPGGHYFRHADAERFNSATQHWERVLDRDLSLLMYVNEDYEGGRISFLNFNFRYKPKSGDLIVFPSDHRFLHEAERVTKGVRYAIVSWGAVEGGPRCKAKPIDSAIFY